MKLNNVKNRFLPIPEAVLKGLEPEANIHDFEIIKELGSGSFGRVYLVKHKATKVQYAIKAIDKRNKQNIEETPYFRREIEIMYKIRHPNVVRLYGHFEDDKYIYFLMEYINKGNIYNLIPKDNSKSLPAERIAKIMKDLICAVYFLHNMNPPIIHRDIKPENILLTDDDVAKLTDFGWSNYITEEEVRKTVCGTPIYLAPEIINQQEHDERVDIWCIGVLLFELTTGNVPFQGNDLETLKRNIMQMNISWPKNISLDAKNLISKILKFNPNERLPIPNILSHPYFTKIIPNAAKSLIKPDENMPHKPYVISKDKPEDEASLYATGGNTNNDEKVLIAQKDALAKECAELREKLKEQEKIIASLSKGNKLTSQNDNCTAEELDLNGKLNELENENSILKDKCEKYEKHLKEQQSYPSLEKKIDELRKTMSENNKEKFMKEIDSLKCELDEETRKHFIMILNEKDKEIMKFKEDLAKLTEKEKKKYSALITRYETANTKLKKENMELKAKK